MAKNTNTSKIVIFDGFWNRGDVKFYRNSLFVFGDNNVQRGAGGQAIIRGLPNTIGIPTKKYPSFHPNAYYTDAEYKDNIKRINEAINDIIYESENYEYVVLPADGFGTGLADLPNRAPKTNAYLIEAINFLKMTI